MSISPIVLNQILVVKDTWIRKTVTECIVHIVRLSRHLARGSVGQVTCVYSTSEESEDRRESASGQYPLWRNLHQ